MWPRLHANRWAAVVGLLISTQAHGQACVTAASGGCAIATPLQQPYQTSTATSGTVAMTQGIGVLFLPNTALIAALTVTLPPSPHDKDLARISAKSGITLLTVKDAAGQVTIAAGVGLGALGSPASHLFQYQGTAWVELE